MILIADSGSTKCDWICLNPDHSTAFKTITMGFNPYFHSQATISTAIKQNEELHAQRENVTAIYYYGAGCSSEALNKIVRLALKVSFPNAQTHVDHDLLGAAYAAYSGKENITCILGTGSNSCKFDGSKVTEEVPALGFILGDEGSGSYFGKKLIAGFMYKQLPEEAYEAFQNTYEIDMADIVSNVYNKPHANVYLASFVRFISNYKTHPYFKEMLHNGMKHFLEAHVLCFENAKNLPINFIGSVAYHFKEAVQSAADELGLTVGEIVQRPAEKLVTYHIKYLLNK